MHKIEHHKEITKVKKRKRSEVQGPLSYDQEKDCFSIGERELRHGASLFVCLAVEKDDWMVYDSRIKKCENGWMLADLGRQAVDFLGQVCFLRS